VVSNLLSGSDGCPDVKIVVGVKVFGGKQARSRRRGLASAFAELSRAACPEARPQP
jgi:hypothetical protein